MVAVTETNILELKKLFSGKVRDVYEVDEGKLLIVATDRISAFDVVFNEGIPGKGEILTRISNKWFSMVKYPHHILSTEPDKELEFIKKYPELITRSVLVKRLKRVDVECVSRGYLFGSAYKDYEKTGTVCGIKLPPGLKLAEKLSEPIFTPAKKAELGMHDENIDFETVVKIVGDRTIAERMRDITLDVYKWAHDLLVEKGIILADTKLEFGLDEDGNLYIIDELLTPDSSRFWDASTYIPGESPVNFDKQFVRDYVESINWDKKPPAPPLPRDVIEKTVERYKAIERIILSL
ncbi:MAG: phosphoribosylaminoimidazolesuccinocarboxamide synthase [Thermosulfidibacteraceae bacterium]|jgi:phosphoribosylaminoimidazole-succinocarboxamide synthase